MDGGGVRWLWLWWVLLVSLANGCLGWPVSYTMKKPAHGSKVIFRANQIYIHKMHIKINEGESNEVEIKVKIKRRYIYSREHRHLTSLPH